MKVIRRSLFALLAACALSHVASAQTSQADTQHGWVDTPLARQTWCSNDGGYWWPEDGSAIPNLACRAAFEKELEVYSDNPQYPFVQINEFSHNVADYRNMQAVMEGVPDGLLCSAGDKNKSGMDVPSPYWHTQGLALNADGTFNIVFHATAQHNPSYWEIYLSKAGFDPASAPLSWGQLDKIADFGDVKADAQGNYVLPNIAIPAGRSGRAVLYTRWQRDDAAGEGFYNCSDVMLPASRTHAAPTASRTSTPVPAPK